MARNLTAHPPRCPFCDDPIERPRDLEPKRLGDFEYGTCGCGAVFVHDVTGHNLGAALVEALGFACHDDWDLAWSLMPGDDYEDALVEGYDMEEHLVQPTGRTREGKRVKGVLSFIRLSADLRDALGSGMASRIAFGSEKHAPPVKTEDPALPHISLGRHFPKKEIEKCVEDRDCTRLVLMTLQDSMVIRRVQRLLYSADPRQRWNAVLSLGAISGGVAQKHPALVGDLVRRLIYSVNDSAAASWGAIEAVGEIIRAIPSQYGSFLRHLLGYLSDPSRRPAVLWAAGRIGEVHPRLVRSHAFFALFDLLGAKDAETRGLAVWALGLLGAHEAHSGIKALIDDKEMISFFDGDIFRSTTVGDLAREAIKRLVAQAEHIKGKGQKDMKELEKAGTSVSDDREGRVRALYKEGVVLQNRGMSLDAMKKFEEAMDLLEGADDDILLANISERIADLHVMRGNFKAAVPVYQRALAICEKRGDPVSIVFLVEKIIDIYRELGEKGKALPYFMRALEIAEKLGDATRTAYYLTGIGDLSLEDGKPQKALDAYRLAHKLYRGMGSRERAEVIEKGIASIERMLAGSSPP